MDTYVYVDAFNLYYGSLKDTPYKWLDIGSLCEKLLPRNKILRIRYFTAMVEGRSADPDQPNRQRLYLRALKTLPNIKIHYGSFQTHPVWRPLVDNPAERVQVLDTKEKGSDVNLATYLIYDGYKELYNIAVVISNDSDLSETIRIVKQELHRTIGIINPHEHACSKLRKQSSFYQRIRRGVLENSQFPDQMNDSKGSFHKPASW